jgi:organic hydroperoxide reductase OsmC/OhrA
MIQYPLRFEFRSDATPGTQSPWRAASPFISETICAIPPEFEGPGGGYSPEDFFGLAVLNCFVGTFKVMAERSRVEFDSLQAEGMLSVDRDAQGLPWMSKMDVRVRVSVARPKQVDRCRRLLEKTATSCLVARSLKTKVRFSVEVGSEAAFA